jgi:WD repeat-containing protein 48
VADCVLDGKWPQVKELKTAFVLQPAEGSGLPSLLQSRLNAPRILEVGRAAGRPPGLAGAGD